MRCVFQAILLYIFLCKKKLKKKCKCKKKKKMASKDMLTYEGIKFPNELCLKLT